ncbi:MAG: PEP-CTERM sorting domain-containing protein [Phycisphaerales bacterium]|nr:MAG: PEP-CTERM sorting domain-containing protein [Phycisphaerales bacterium]
MRSTIVALVSVVGLCAAVPAMAVDAYVELVPWSVINNGASTSHFAQVVEGQASYHNLNLGGGGGIVRVDNLDGVQTMTELVTPLQWSTANLGVTANMSAYYGFSISGDYLQFAETGTDAIWRVNKSTGAITEYVSKATIDTYIGGTGPSLLSPFDTHPISGEMVFYEGDIDSLLITTGVDGLADFITAAQLTAAVGNASVSGGIGFASDGTLYWGSSTSDDMWKLPFGGNPDTDITQVLSTADITAVTGGTAYGPKDIFCAPDGWVYMGDSSSGSILRFDPADPPNTLETFLTSQQLADGPAATSNVITFGWYDAGGGGALTFNRFNDYGLYWVPEPASALLLSLGGLALLRRRR